MLKRYADWTGSLNKYLQIGDIVDEEMVDYFINVLPPATMNGRCIQIGEPCDYVKGKSTFSTLKNTNEGWVYAGQCHRGETVEPI